MVSEQSDRACTLCRQRRVRCDKTLPACHRCSKFGQTCPGYPSRQRFIDQSSSVRKRLNDQISSSGAVSEQQPLTPLERSPRDITFSNVTASQPQKNRGAHVFNAGIDSANTSSPAAKSSTSTAGSHVSFSSPTISYPVHQQPSPGNSVPEAPHTDALMVDVTADQVFGDPGFDYFDLDIETYYTNGTNACGFFPDIPISLPLDDGIGVIDGIHDLQLIGTGSANSSLTPQLPVMSGLKGGEVSFDKEIALLIHLFVDCLAPWMDLFDFDAYFTRVLPADVMPNILLQSAVAAVAAKQTARHVSYGCGDPGSRHYALILANYQDVSSNEWFYKAACYYDRGISHLRAQLRQSSVFSNQMLSPASNAFGPITPSDHSTRLSISEDVQKLDSGMQQLFSAISIFSLYESMDDCLARSSQHIPGFLALFDNESVPFIPRSLTAGRAAFWYFARKEALASYTHHSKPKIDPNRTSVWTSAGVPVQVFRHFSMPTSASNDLDPPHFVIYKDRDTAHRVLIWILTKVVDLIALNNSSQSSPASLHQNMLGPQDPTSFHSANGLLCSLSSIWSRLRAFLIDWYDNRSCLLTPHGAVESKNPTAPTSRPRRMVFFTNPTGAAALQLYHFIHILLLINQPTDQMNQGSRLRMLKENSVEVEFHSREISAIASGHQPLAIQRHMSHPLQLAGTSLETKQDRDVVDGLLREIAAATSSPIETPG